jgi:hypothetical protein
MTTGLLFFYPGAIGSGQTVDCYFFFSGGKWCASSTKASMEKTPFFAGYCDKNMLLDNKNGYIFSYKSL